MPDPYLVHHPELGAVCHHASEYSSDRHISPRTRTNTAPLPLRIFIASDNILQVFVRLRGVLRSARTALCRASARCPMWGLFQNSGMERLSQSRMAPTPSKTDAHLEPTRERCQTKHKTESNRQICGRRHEVHPNERLHTAVDLSIVTKRESTGHLEASTKRD